MSERELALLLEDIIHSIDNIFQFTAQMTPEQYESDLKTKFAVERNFEIIGEAASRVPAAIKKKYPHIEWRIIKDFRNFMIHDYFGINNQIVWNTIRQRLPGLKIDIEKILSDYNK